MLRTLLETPRAASTPSVGGCDPHLEAGTRIPPGSRPSRAGASLGFFSGILPFACRLRHDGGMAYDTDEKNEISNDFDEAVNMTPAGLEKWLDTDEAKSVGQKDGGGESVGHESGRRIVAILRSKKSELSDADFDHMKKVTGYVHRHLAQRPEKDIHESAWRYSLMNWGHDPE
jgi:Protein of unknown function (DUF3140)